MPAARITFGYAHSTRIRTGALSFAQCGHLCAHYAQRPARYVPAKTLGARAQPYVRTY